MLSDLKLLYVRGKSGDIGNIKRYLEFMDYNVVETNSEIEALNLMKENSFDIVFLEEIIGVLNGYMLAKIICNRCKENSKNIKIVIIGKSYKDIQNSTSNDGYFIIPDKITFVETETVLSHMI